MSEILHYVNQIRDATTPLGVMLNVDFLTDEFEKIDVKKEVLKAYGMRKNAQMGGNLHQKRPAHDNKTLQMHRLWATLRGS